MKVLAITSVLLVACSSAAALAGPAETYKTDEALKARDADAAPEPVPGWWGFRWSRHGSGGWKRDAAPEPVPGWWGFRWSGRGSGGWKRDAANAAKPEDDADFIYLPKGMTPEDLTAMVKDAQSDSAPDATKTEETKA
jgi:hypothetical protein